ncbi:hypothetical protein [Desulfopila sp. IMCC35008]|uniref:hypothetical protein n=1 Tax=Desulfopila sp. IMCC35008 TaxID=2653858 RepID=UPI0013D858B7|nr:hypothetical protein [Desulfopila sp. IMCC35008]
MLTPSCRPLLIGSLPLTDHHQAVTTIMEYCPEIPLWPQLPKHHREGMVRQFLSGFPGLTEDGKKFWIDTRKESFTDEMTGFYEDHIAAADDLSFFQSSRFGLHNDTAPGFLALTQHLEDNSIQPYTVKGQVTGPVTTGIGTRDDQDRSIFYDDSLRDILVKLLAGKARWQVIELKKLTGKTPPIVFIDEPGMVSFGSSAFTGVTAEMVGEAVGEVIESIHEAGGLAGIHICANGDWGPALLSETDIISFDAYSYFDNFILFKDHLCSFLQRGGFLAWGIVPTGDPIAVEKETSITLFARWQEQVQKLSSFGISQEQLLKQTFITPACGTGSLSPELALKVLTMNRELSELARSFKP